MKRVDDRNPETTTTAGCHQPQRTDQAKNTMLTEIKIEVRALCATLPLAVALLAAGCGGGKAKSQVADLEALGAELKEQMANGELSAAEAQVKYAEAFAEAKRRDRVGVKGKAATELEALGAELKAQVEEGELTAEEAKAKWIEAKETTGDEAEAEGKMKQAEAETEGPGIKER